MPVWYSTTAGCPNFSIAPGFEIAFAPAAGPAALELLTTDDAGTDSEDAVSDDDAGSDVEVPPSEELASDDAVLDDAGADEAVDEVAGRFELEAEDEGGALLATVALVVLLSELAPDVLPAGAAVPPELLLPQAVSTMVSAAAGTRAARDQV